MRAVATTLSAVDVPSEKGRVAIAVELTKARLTLMVVLTALVGFYLGSSSPVDFALMLHTVLGTASVAAGAAVLNQFLEREHDSRMNRTAGRPLPAGHISPSVALIIGAALSIVGMGWLLLLVNPLTASLGALTLSSYLFVYTPLKRITVLNTVVGAVPGALPPLMGWAAATGRLSPAGFALFGILFFWQLPHFMAIAWLYRKDYSDAGFRMLSAVDPDGRRTAASAVRNSVALLAVSLFPFMFGFAGRFYLIGAVILGGAMLFTAVSFSRKLTMGAARRLFFASIIYLPLLLGLLVADKRSDLNRTLTSSPRVSTELPLTISAVPLMPLNHF